MIIQKQLMENLNQFYLQMILVRYLPIIIFKVVKNHIKIEFESLNKWFQAKRLSLNFDKTHLIQFKTKNNPQIDYGH